LKSLGIDNIMKFDLMDHPPVGSMTQALEELYALEAIDETGKLTTKCGVLLAEFPLEPKAAKMVLSSFDFGCVEECISIAAMLQVNGVFLFARSAAQKRDRDLALASMVDKSGDHVTFANIFADENWRDIEHCRDFFLNHRSLSRADEIRNQLRGYVRRLANVQGGLPSCGTEGKEAVTSILRAVSKGLAMNVAKLASDGFYRTLRGDMVVEVSPKSVYSQFGKVEEYIVYNFTEDSPGKEGLLRLDTVSGVQGRYIKEDLKVVFGGA